MRSGRKFFALGALLLLITGLGACSSGPDPAEEKAAQDAEAWAALQEAKTTLDTKRAELMFEAMLAQAEANKLWYQCMYC